MINADAKKVMALINKRFGENTVVIGEEIRGDLIQRATTGSTTFDYILGGGFPTNQWNELVGEPSHGKTAIALKVIAANQALDPEYTAVWVAAEQWVPEYAEMCGVDTSRVIVIETNIMEEAYDAVIAFAESKSVDAIVIDSLPALVPGPEDEKSMDEMTVGRGALITNKFFRKAGAAMKRSMVEAERPILGIIINQYRDKITSYGDPRTTPGGKGKNFFYFQRAEVRREDWIDNTRDEHIGQTIKLTNKKNKLSPPGRVGMVDAYFAKGNGFEAGSYDEVKDTIAAAIAYEVIEKTGQKKYEFGDHIWKNGRPGMEEDIREDTDLQKSIREQVLAAAKAGVKESGHDLTDPEHP